MAVVWTYDGGTGSLNAVIDDAVPGDKYELWCSDSNSSPTTSTAGSSTLSITVTGIGGDSAGYGFGAYLYHGTSSVVSVSSPCVYDNVFAEGTSSSGAGLGATWTYDGTTGFSITFIAAGGITYNLAAHVTTGTISQTTGGPYTNGTSQTISLTSATPTTGRSFWVDLTDNSTSEDFANRIFVQGVAGAGTEGNTGGTPVVEGRVLIAWDDGPLVASPTWTVLDQGGDFPVNFVSGYDTKNGRQTLISQTETGTATVYINDRAGLLDDRNSSSPYQGKLSGRQIMLQLFNPVTSTWEPQFRGLIENYTYTIDGTAVGADGAPVNASIVIDCVDVFDYLNLYGLTPGLDGQYPGPPPTPPTKSNGATPSGSEDSVYYPATSGTAGDRVIEILTDAGIDPSMYDVSSGNVFMTESKYNADESALTALRDAADAEIPFLANVYCSRFGHVCWRGRYARFYPDEVAGEIGSTWDFTRWPLGDGAAIISDPSRGQLRAITYSRDRAELINAAIAYPQGIKPADIPGQVFANSPSITAYGKHQASPMSDLFVAGGNESAIGGGSTADFTANEETAAYAELLVKNKKDPRISIDTIQLKSINPSDPRAAVTWAPMCGADISHIVNVAVGYPGGTGLAGDSPEDDYYIEGRALTVRPANTAYDDVTVDLTVSPAVWSMDLNGIFPNPFFP